MKHVYFILSVGTLFFSNILSGYGIVHHSSSALPEVDIYVYKVNSPEEAQAKHKKYAKVQGIPDNVLDVFDKITGITAPIAKKIDKETDGISVGLQEGFELAVGALQAISKAFKQPITTALAHYFRGEDHALHKNVPRGNRGRFAEWDTNNTMYAIVTLHDSLIPLHNVPKKINPHMKSGFTVKSENMAAPSVKPAIVENKEEAMSIAPLHSSDSEKKLYKVDFRSSYANEYISAEKDKRNRANIKEAAKIDGSKAANL